MNLNSHIRNLIKFNGPIPLDQFMQLAIEFYYTNHQPFGQKGDFITAPEISQMFGEMIGIWCANIWIDKNKPTFTLVEIGGGRGTLMSDLIRGTKNIIGFHDSVEEIIMVEISPALQTVQKTNINFDRVRWVKHLSEITNNNCIITCNEFFDALPIKQYKKSNGQLHEIQIDVIGNKLSFIETKAGADINLETIPEGAIVEISPQSKEYAKLISDKSIAALIIDYGYFKPPFKSTLQALKSHKHTPVLENVGDSDLTSLVDFKTLAKCFANKDVNLSTQSEFLIKYGIQQRAEKLKSLAKNTSIVDSDLERLISHEQMGELFKVLVAK